MLIVLHTCHNNNMAEENGIFRVLGLRKWFCFPLSCPLYITACIRTLREFSVISDHTSDLAMFSLSSPLATCT